MKTKVILTLAAAGALIFGGCDKDDDGITVGTQYKSAFETMYPQAKGVKWEKKGSYYVAEFRRTEFNAEAEAWYGNNAQWELTVTDISYNALPAPVRTAHEAGTYAAWRVDDVDMVERPDYETVYVLDVEKGEQEYDLYYTADGTLVKAVPDSEGGNDPSDYIPQELSTAITQFITTEYPGAKIIEIDREVNGIEVDIMDGTVHRELFFTTAGAWQYTKTEVARNSVPTAIMNAFNSSDFASYPIDDTDHFNTPDGEYYIFELDAEPNDIYVKVTLDGSVQKVDKIG